VKPLRKSSLVREVIPTQVTHLPPLRRRKELLQLVLVVRKASKVAIMVGKRTKKILVVQGKQISWRYMRTRIG